MTNCAISMSILWYFDCFDARENYRDQHFKTLCNALHHHRENERRRRILDTSFVIIGNEFLGFGSIFQHTVSLLSSLSVEAWVGSERYQIFPEYGTWERTLFDQELQDCVFTVKGSVRS